LRGLRLHDLCATGARAGLLANSGYFVSKCVVLCCFVVFCGCFVMFCGCFAVFCECFAVFPQNTQDTRKTSENTGKHKNLTIRSCNIAGVFQEPKKFDDCIAQNTFHKTSAKHRKTPQNTVKQSQNAFCEITSQNTAKRTQNARKRHKTLTIQPQCVLRAFGVFFQNKLDLSRKHAIRNIRVNYGGGVTYPRGVT